MKTAATGGGRKVLDKNFFIIMDRLYGTLADKIKSWKQAQRDCRGGPDQTRDVTHRIVASSSDRLMTLWPMAAS